MTSTELVTSAGTAPAGRHGGFVQQLGEADPVEGQMPGRRGGVVFSGQRALSLRRQRTGPFRLHRRKGPEACGRPSAAGIR
jgi:hypothetical protein